MKKSKLIPAIIAAVVAIGAAVTLVILYRDKIAAFLSDLAERVKALCPCCEEELEVLPEEYEDFADVDDFAVEEEA